MELSQLGYQQGTIPSTLVQHTQLDNMTQNIYNNLSYTQT
jgi:hypothetical protein